MQLKDDRELSASVRKQTWDYFVVHASQRMSCFQYFISLATALCGATVLLIKDEANLPYVAAIGILLTCISLVFARLDRRTRALIKNAEAALVLIDNVQFRNESDSDARVFGIVALGDSHVGDTSSYSTCFKAIFGLFGLIGAIVAIGSLVVLGLGR